MKKAIILLSVLVSSNVMAHEHALEFYKGQQAVGIAGEAMECYVEVQELHDVETLQVRALVGEPHGSRRMMIAGPLRLTQTPEGYYFRASHRHDLIQEALLAQKDGVAWFDLVVSHGHHTDALSCENLVMTQGAEKLAIEELFEQHDGSHYPKGQ